MNEINEKKVLKEIHYENAVIKSGCIIPGLNGIEVDEIESYYKMSNNEDYFSFDNFVYTQVKPKISLEENKHLVVKKGNMNKNSVSIILEYDKDIIEYITQINLKINVIVDDDNFDKNANYEQISHNENTDKMFQKYKLYNELCFVNEQNYKQCLNNNKYLINYTYEVDNKSIYKLDVNSGDIIYIKKLTLDNFKYLLRKINYRNLKIVFVSTLISEFRENSIS